MTAGVFFLFISHKTVTWKWDPHLKTDIFSDVLTQNPDNKETETLATSLATLQPFTEQTIIHCDIQGNGEAQRQANYGGKLPNKQ